MGAFVHSSTAPGQRKNFQQSFNFIEEQFWQKKWRRKISSFPPHRRNLTFALKMEKTGYGNKICPLPTPTPSVAATSPCDKQALRKYQKHYCNVVLEVDQAIGSSYLLEAYRANRSIYLLPYKKQCALYIYKAVSSCLLKINKLFDVTLRLLLYLPITSAGPSSVWLQVQWFDNYSDGCALYES